MGCATIDAADDDKQNGARNNNYKIADSLIHNSSRRFVCNGVSVKLLFNKNQLCVPLMLQ